MEISAEKTTLMTNNTSGINTKIKVTGQKLETVTSFKYLGSVITNEGCKPEVLSRMAQTTAALTRLKPVLNDRSISLSSNIRLIRSRVTPIFLYACESWALTASSKEKYKPWKWSATRKILPIQRPCYQRGSPCRDPADNRTTRRSPDHCKETQTAVVWTCLSFITSGRNHLARHTERGKKTRQTVEEVGRQHEGMEKVRQVPEGSGEHGGKNGGNWSWNHLLYPNDPRG